MSCGLALANPLVGLERTKIFKLAVHRASENQLHVTYVLRYFGKLHQTVKKCSDCFLNSRRNISKILKTSYVLLWEFLQGTLMWLLFGVPYLVCLHKSKEWDGMELSSGLTYVEDGLTKPWYSASVEAFPAFQWTCKWGLEPKTSRNRFYLQNPKRRQKTAKLLQLAKGSTK